jgi:hypothetical protein
MILSRRSCARTRENCNPLRRIHKCSAAFAILQPLGLEGKKTDDELEIGRSLLHRWIVSRSKSSSRETASLLWSNDPADAPG